MEALNHYSIKNTRTVNLNLYATNYFSEKFEEDLPNGVNDCQCFAGYYPGYFQK